jgi:inhibitor of KinA
MAETGMESHPSPAGEGQGVRFYPISERAVTLQFGNTISLSAHEKVLQYSTGIQQASMPGFVECVPAYTTLTIHFDVVAVHRSNLIGQTPIEKISNFIHSLKIDSNNKKQTLQIQEIPVCYDMDFGLDLNELSKSLSLSVDEIIKLHSSAVYTVFMIGFTPGFPYMGETNPRLACNRKANPRKKVPAGSVAIAGQQTGIYPFDTPGGWQIVGCTPLKLFAPTSDPPARLQAGQQVKFKPINRKEFDKMVKA